MLFSGRVLHVKQIFDNMIWLRDITCAMVKSRYIGDGHPTFNRNPYNWYIKPYYWVDDHPLLYGNNGSLDSELADRSREVLPRPLWGGSNQ